MCLNQLPQRTRGVAQRMVTVRSAGASQGAARKYSASYGSVAHRAAVAVLDFVIRAVPLVGPAVPLALAGDA